MQIDIPRESVERLELPVDMSADPTAFTNEWAFTDTDETTRPGDPGAAWIGGTWKAAGQAGGTLGFTRVALTPILGSGSADLAPGHWQPYMRINTGSENPVFKLDDTIHIT